MGPGRVLVWVMLLALLTGSVAAEEEAAELSPPDGFVWQGPEVVAETEGPFTDVHLASDEEGTVHVVWITDGQAIHYRARTAEGWQAPELVDESKTRRLKPAAVRVAARGDQLWVVHRRDVYPGRSRIVAIRRTDEGWGERERLSEIKVTQLPPTAYVDAAGELQVYWFVLMPVPVAVRNVEHELYSRRHNSQGWSAERKVMARTVNLFTPTICFDRQGQAHVAWFTWFRHTATRVKGVIIPHHYGFVHQVTRGEPLSLRPPRHWPFMIIAPGGAALAAAVDQSGHWHGLARLHPQVMSKQEDHFFYITNREGSWPKEVKPVVTRPGQSTGALVAGGLGERGVLLAWQEGTKLCGFLVGETGPGSEWAVPVEGEALFGTGGRDGRFHLLAARGKGGAGRGRRPTELLYYRMSPVESSQRTPAEDVNR